MEGRTTAIAALSCRKTFVKRSSRCSIAVLGAPLTTGDESRRPPEASTGQGPPPSSLKLLDSTNFGTSLHNTHPTNYLVTVSNYRDFDIEKVWLKLYEQTSGQPIIFESDLDYFVDLKI